MCGKKHVIQVRGADLVANFDATYEHVDRAIALLESCGERYLLEIETFYKCRSGLTEYDVDHSIVAEFLDGVPSDAVVLVFGKPG